MVKYLSEGSPQNLSHIFPKIFSKVALGIFQKVSPKIFPEFCPQALSGFLRKILPGAQENYSKCFFEKSFISAIENSCRSSSWNFGNFPGCFFRKSFENFSENEKCSRFFPEFLPQVLPETLHCRATRNCPMQYGNLHEQGKNTSTLVRLFSGNYFKNSPENAFTSFFRKFHQMLSTEGSFEIS